MKDALRGELLPQRDVVNVLRLCSGRAYTHILLLQGATSRTSSGWIEPSGQQQTKIQELGVSHRP